MAGWITLHRAILDHWVWNNADYAKAWVTILLTVNHEDKKAEIHGEFIMCGRGQSILSLQSWAKLFGRKWSVQKVRTFFDLLKKDEMITTEGLRKTTRLTVCNYDTYQQEQQTKNTQRTRKQHTDNTEVTTNNNDNNDIDKSISTWRSDFKVYLENCRAAFNYYYNDDDFLNTYKRLNPNVNVKVTMDRAYTNYWGTKDGWENKKKTKTEKINWRLNIGKSISMPMNRVYYTKQELLELEK